MNAITKPHPWGRIGAVLLIYMVLYVLGAAFDLWTTTLALQRPDIHEGNIAATTDGAFDLWRAISWNIAGGALLGVCVTSSLFFAPKVAPRWLEAPRRSFAHLYVLPWRARHLAYTPIHMLSYAFAFILLRVIAGSNNALLATGHTGILSWPIRQLAGYTGELTAVVSIVSLLYVGLTLAIAPTAAATLRWARALQDK